MISYMTPWKKVRAAMHPMGRGLLLGMYIHIYSVLYPAVHFSGRRTVRSEYHTADKAVFRVDGNFCLRAFLSCGRFKRHARKNRTFYAKSACDEENSHSILIRSASRRVYNGQYAAAYIARCKKRVARRGFNRRGHIRHGDIGAKRQGKEKAQLSELCAAAKTFVCLGNHDMLTAEPERDEWIKDFGITVLKDEAVKLSDVTVFGRRDVHDGERKPTEGLKHLRSEAPLIILDHNPRDYRENFSLGAFLTLSGHTHGGQTFPGNIAQKIFMKTPVYGHLTEGGKHLIVTSGAGFWGPPAPHRHE